MSVSLRDIAARAGVSVKTVSNVVNGTGRVGAQTRERVTRMLTELDYRPNISARSLRQARSGVIALGVPELANPYFAELAQLIVAEAERRDWTVLVDQTAADPERERLVLQGIRRHLIDGLLFIPRAMVADDVVERTDQTPLVLLGQHVTRIADRVAIDSHAAATMAVTHLFELGRRRIALLGATADSTDAVARARFNGYRGALANAGVRFSRRLVVRTGPWQQRQGAEAIDCLVARGARPDAVFCANDLLAHGALRALHTHGIRVPDDVAVIGIDDITDNQYRTPTLSSIAPDKDSIAHTAVELLASRIQAPNDAPAEVVAGFRLAARESTVGSTSHD